MIVSLLFWIITLIFATVVLVKGADYFIDSSEHIGRALRLSPFVIGVLLVGVGTSLPEFASSIAALVAGSVDIVAANAVGSNITNILLVVGILAILGRKVVIKQDLLASELSLFAISTALFIGIAFDGVISQFESLFLATAFIIYVLYIIFGNGDTPAEQKYILTQDGEITTQWKTVIVFLLGLTGVVVGARVLISSAVAIADILHVGTGIVAITVVALGTSLPELFVSLSALVKGKTEVAIGNIFGSNAFNILFAVGVPGLISTLPIDAATLSIGLPILAVVSFLFILIGIAQRVYRWEGFMFLLFYVFFITKIIGL